MNIVPALPRIKAPSILRSRLSLMWLMCIALLVVVVGCSQQSVPTDPAPDFQLTLYGTETRQAGEMLRLSDLRGKPVVLNFWFPSCPPCVAEMPEFERVFQNHRGHDVEFVGVQLLGIDTAEDGQNFVSEVGVTYALGPDEDDIITKYKVNGFPMTVFIDKDQNVVRRWQGVLNEEKMEEILGEIIN